MLYVSRVIERGRYVVTDTDDGTDEIVTSAQLRRIVRVLKIQVNGCTDDGVFVIRVYSPEASTAVTKLKTLRGVECAVVDGVLRAMDFTRRDNDFSIRLSSLCSSIDNNVFVRTEIGSGSGYVTLIVDDDVSFDSKKCFVGVREKSFIKLDLTALSDDDVVDDIYGTVRTNIVGISTEIRSIIIDREGRYQRYLAEQALRLSLKSEVLFPEELLKQEDYVLSRYRPVFEWYKDKKLEWKVVTNTCISLYDEYEMTPEEVSSNALSNKSFIRKFGQAVSDLSKFVRNDMVLFTNYMLYWGNDKEMQGVWYDLCMQAAWR